MESDVHTMLRRTVLFLLLLVAGLVSLPDRARCETYGFRNAQGKFVPKVSVTVGTKEIVIRKVKPAEKFNSIAFILNQKNVGLTRNVNMLNLEWIDAANKPGKPIPFTGPLYDAATLTYKDAMAKSAAVKIIDKSPRSHFSGKSLPDLLTIQIDDRTLVLASETREDREPPVPSRTGPEAITLDRNSVLFNKNNYKAGEILNVDNRSGVDQVLGVEIPQKGMLYSQIIGNPEQNKIPRENWERFPVPAGSGIFIVLIPEPDDPALLAQLDGQEIAIKVYQDGKVRQTYKVPIKISQELRMAGEIGRGDETPESRPGQPLPETSRRSTEPETGFTPEARQGPPQPQAGPARRETSIWLWGLIFVNLALLLAVAGYGIFFILPKIQVLEDRLAKNEMFIHSSREAIREELDHIKQEILGQCRGEAESEPE